MRLIYFSNCFPQPFAPQRATFNRSLLLTMAKEHELSVISPMAWTDAFRNRKNAQQPPSIETSELPFPVSFPTFYYPPKFFRERYDQFMWWSTQHELSKQIKELKPAAVLSYWAHPDGAVAVRAAHEAGIPGIVMVGGSDVLLLTKNPKRKKVIYKALHEADAVVAVNNHIRNTLLDNGLPESKVHVVRRGVDRELFQQRDKSDCRQQLAIDPTIPLIISAGRLVSVKGFDSLLVACQLLKDQEFDFQCRLIGSGPLKEALTAQIESLGLSRHIQLVGMQTQDQLSTWYNAADTVALCSSSEGVTNVLLECISCGVPFVATDVGGIPEIADLARDVLVPHNDAQAIADGIRKCCDQPTIESPRSFIPSTWEESAAKLTQIIESLTQSEEMSIQPKPEPLSV